MVTALAALHTPLYRKGRARNAPFYLKYYKIL
jgi:hypothetical protein